jgi:uncharacterized protein YndB with AHSA1/START domain
MTTRDLTIEQAYFVKSPAAKVFRALTDPRQLSTWFLSRATLDLRKGGAYEFEWQGGYHHAGTILEVIRGKQLTLSWPNRVGAKRSLSRVTFRLRSDGRGTLVQLRHQGYARRDPWIEVYGATQCGWGYFLTNLKSVLEHGHDLRSPKDV